MFSKAYNRSLISRFSV